MSLGETIQIQGWYFTGTTILWKPFILGQFTNN